MATPSILNTSQTSVPVSRPTPPTSITNLKKTEFYGLIVGASILALNAGFIK